MCRLFGGLDPDLGGGQNDIAANENSGKIIVQEINTILVSLTNREHKVTTEIVERTFDFKSQNWRYNQKNAF